MIEYYHQVQPIDFYTPSTAASIYWWQTSTCDALEMTYEQQHCSYGRSQ